MKRPLILLLTAGILLNLAGCRLPDFSVSNIPAESTVAEPENTAGTDTNAPEGATQDEPVDIDASTEETTIQTEAVIPDSIPQPPSVNAEPADEDFVLITDSMICKPGRIFLSPLDLMILHPLPTGITAIVPLRRRPMQCF